MALERNQPEHSTQPVAAVGSGGGADHAFRARVEQTLALIRPSVQADAGDIELISADPNGLVRIKFHGACVGCPSADMTLHHGIERALRGALGPNVRVEAV